jgi:hypothetical protein
VSAAGTRRFHGDADEGLARIGEAELVLRERLDRTFERWAVGTGAERAVYPPLLRVADLHRIDYFDNFPHLAVLASGIDAPALEAGGDVAAGGVVPTDALHDCAYALPSAACFSVYFRLAGQTLAEPALVTTVANCFRRESGYEGFRRLLGFSMREVVCVGDRDAVLDHLRTWRERVTAALDAVDLPARIVPSEDPFFDPDAGRALMARLFPVKEEVVYGEDLAIASLNFHRNFFGERCDIRTADGEHAFSGCMAFGLERWMAALSAHLGDDVDAILGRLDAWDAIA